MEIHKLDVEQTNLIFLFKILSAILVYDQKVNVGGWTGGAGVRGERGREAGGEGGKWGERGREAGREGEGSGERGGGKRGERGGGKQGERGREAKIEGEGSGERGGGKRGLDTPLSTPTNVGNDQEMAQSETNSHPKNRGGKT